MKIYLAGKICPQRGSWRDALIETRYDTTRRAEVPGWHLVRAEDDNSYVDSDGHRVSLPWPTAPNTRVLGLHEYVGPYRTVLASGTPEWKYYGEFHGSIVEGQHGASNGTDDDLIVAQCRAAIERADLVFAYINSPDCYGTLVELGMAVASNVFTVAAFERGVGWDWDDYWFTQEVIDAVVDAPPTITVPDAPPLEEFCKVQMGEPLSEAFHRAYDEYATARDAEHDRVRHMLEAAIVRWAARPSRPMAAVVPLYDQRQAYELVAQVEGRYARWIAEVAEWTSDPRVRSAANRLLRTVTQP